MTTIFIILFMVMFVLSIAYAIWITKMYYNQREKQQDIYFQKYEEIRKKNLEEIDDVHLAYQTRETQYREYYETQNKSIKNNSYNVVVDNLRLAALLKANNINPDYDHNKHEINEPDYVAPSNNYQNEQEYEYENYNVENKNNEITEARIPII